MSNTDSFTTIAVLRDADIPRLDDVNEAEFGGEASYRAVINFLVDHYEGSGADDAVDSEDIEALIERKFHEAVIEGRAL